MKFLVIGEVEAGAQSDTVTSLALLARELADKSDELVVALSDSIHEDNLKSLGTYVDKIYLIPELSIGSEVGPHALAKALVRVAQLESPDLILLEETYAGSEIGAYLGAALRYQVVNTCTRVTRDAGRIQVTTRVFAGKIAAFVDCAQRALLLMSQVPKIEASFEQPDKIANIERLVIMERCGELVISVNGPEVGAVDIKSAKIIISVGRGVEKDLLPKVEKLSHLIGGEMACSRPMVDMGLMDRARQVGKSGQTVTPELYVAIGISGAPEHLEGMENSKIVLAINTDENASIFANSDYACFEDAEEFIDECISQLA